MSRGPRIWVVVAVAVAFAVVAGVVLRSSDSDPSGASGASGSSGSSGGAPSDGAGDLSATLRSAVTLDGVVEHLEAFQSIANSNDGNRSAGTSGYDESASYIAERLRDAGYEVEFQDFAVPVFEQESPAVLAEVGGRSFEEGDDFAVMLYSGSGRGSAPVVTVDLDLGAPSSSSGCEASDFASFPSGAVALVRRANCFFRDQAANAAAAQAVGVLVAQEPGAPGALRGTLTTEFQADIPVMGITNKLARSFSVGERIRISVDAITEDRSTSNVLASMPGSDESPVVMVGAHLDSVPGGPGINDNGSGSAVVLEVAEEIADMDPPTPLRFAWWGGEEFGLLGSVHYVLGLSEDEHDEVAAYLNFDMLGSPNYVRFVYDARNAGATDVEGSVAIQEMFESYFESQDLPTELIPLEGRSDHALFGDVGIPIGGLFSGADDVKTSEEADLYGGEEGAIHDPCYHLACDAIDNVNTEILDQMADGVAHGVATLVLDPGLVGGG